MMFPNRIPFDQKHKKVFKASVKLGQTPSLKILQKNFWKTVVWVFL